MWISESRKFHLVNRIIYDFESEVSQWRNPLKPSSGHRPSVLIDQQSVIYLRIYVCRDQVEPTTIEAVLFPMKIRT